MVGGGNIFAYFNELLFHPLHFTVNQAEQCCICVGTNGEVRLPVENGEDLEENMEETLVCPQRRRAALLQLTCGFYATAFIILLLIMQVTQLQF